MIPKIPDCQKKRLNIYIYGIRDQNLAPLSIQQGLNRRCPDPYGVTPSQRGPHSPKPMHLDLTAFTATMHRDDAF